MVRLEKGIPISSGITTTLLSKAVEGDKTLGDVAERLTGDKNKYFTHMIVNDNQVAPTITSGGSFYRMFDKTRLADEDFRNVQTFPQDYNFKGNNVQYVCGMSVPPNMMANIATEVYEQWLK